MANWPLQKNCNTYYGNPRGSDGGPSAKWEAANLTTVKPPYRMTYDGKPIKAIRVHKKCADSLLRVLDAIWEASGRRQAVVDGWGASIYGGAYNYRLMRGGTALSMHSWGCAIDLDPARNGLGDQTPYFDNCPEVLAAFAAEGWEWGGSWSKRDGMHWQASWTRPNAVSGARMAFASLAELPPAADEIAAFPAAQADDPVAVLPIDLPLSDPAVDEPKTVVTNEGYTDPHQVELVQTWLRNLGYTEVGTPNGKLGAFTKGAIAAYRASKGMPPGQYIDDELILKLATDKEPRELPATRTDATAADVRARVPAAKASFLNRIWSYVLGAVGAVVAFVKGIIENISDAKSYLYPIQDFLSSIPAWAWALGAVGIAAALYVNARRSEVALERGFKDGSIR